MSGEVCIPNIGPAQRRLRLMLGVLLSAVSIAAAAWLLATGAPRAWRLVLFLPLWIAALGFLQVWAKTCVALAARGVRNMDRGDEPVGDAGVLRQMQAQARQVQARALLAAAAATAVLVAVPG